jgi:hypothetical protein
VQGPLEALRFQRRDNVGVKVDGPVVLHDVDGPARLVIADTGIVLHQFLHADDPTLIIDHGAGAGIQLRHYTPMQVAIRKRELRSAAGSR